MPIDTFRFVIRASANPSYPDAAQLSEIQLLPQKTSAADRQMPSTFKARQMSAQYFNGILTVRLPPSVEGAFTANIFDISGRVIFEKRAFVSVASASSSNNEFRFGAIHCPNGIYFLSMDFEDKKMGRFFRPVAVIR